VNDDILGSLEFGCHVAGAKLIVVLGHSQCGAIKGAVDHVELGHLTGMLQKIQPAVGGALEPRDQAKRTSGNEAFVQSAISKQSTVLNEMKQAGRIDLVGAMYDVASGSVKFLEAS
jgi:carbonic anhydrase